MKATSDMRVGFYVWRACCCVRVCASMYWAVSWKICNALLYILLYYYIFIYYIYYSKWLDVALAVLWRYVAKNGLWLKNDRFKKVLV